MNLFYNNGIIYIINKYIYHIVNCLFNKVNIIIVHDTNNKEVGGNIYGYKRIKVPDNYITSKGVKSDFGLTIYIKN